MSSKIEWCDETINPIIGCEPISEGCRNCYASRFAKRNMTVVHKLARSWDGSLYWQPGQLEKIDKFKANKKVFVGSMSDLFHDNMPEEFIDSIMWKVRTLWVRY